jgi:hypothetical protein
MRRFNSFHLGLVLLAAASLGAGACSGGKERSQPEVEAKKNTGNLALGLTARGASGALYRLREAFFEIDPLGSGGSGGSGSGGFAGQPFPFPEEPGMAPSAGGSAGSGSASGGRPGAGGGSSMGGFGGGVALGGASTGGFAGSFGGFGGSFPGSFPTFLFSEDDPTATTLEASLNTGNYAITLFSGWFLEKVVEGEAVAVDATLLSPQTQFFSIQTNDETFVSYRFETNGEIIDFGQGRLIVDIEVEETNGNPNVGAPLPIVGGLIQPGSNPHGVQAALYNVAAPQGSSITVTSDTGAVCVSGNIDPVLDGDFATQWGAEFGLVFLDAALQEAPWNLDGGRATGLSFTVSGSAIPPLRFRATPGGQDPTVDIFCTSLLPSPGETVPVSFDSLTRECWIPGGLPLVSMDLRAIGWNLPSDPFESHAFDFCVSDLRPLLR